MKLLREVYKTYEGARKRCAFENAMARGEFERGDKARHYHYMIVPQGDTWRVQRSTVKREMPEGEQRWELALKRFVSFGDF